MAGRIEERTARAVASLREYTRALEKKTAAIEEQNTLARGGYTDSTAPIVVPGARVKPPPVLGRAAKLGPTPRAAPVVKAPPPPGAPRAPKAPPHVDPTPTPMKNQPKQRQDSKYPYAFLCNGEPPFEYHEPATTEEWKAVLSIAFNIIPDSFSSQRKATENVLVASIVFNNLNTKRGLTNVTLEGVKVKTGQFIKKNGITFAEKPPLYWDNAKETVTIPASLLLKKLNGIIRSKSVSKPLNALQTLQDKDVLIAKTEHGFVVFKRYNESVYVSVGGRWLKLGFLKDYKKANLETEGFKLLKNTETVSLATRVLHKKGTTTDKDKAEYRITNVEVSKGYVNLRITEVSAPADNVGSLVDNVDPIAKMVVVQYNVLDTETNAEQLRARASSTTRIVTVRTPEEESDESEGNTPVSTPPPSPKPAAVDAYEFPYNNYQKITVVNQKREFLVNEFAQIKPTVDVGENDPMDTAEAATRLLRSMAGKELDAVALFYSKGFGAKLKHMFPQDRTIPRIMPESLRDLKTMQDVLEELETLYTKDERTIIGNKITISQARLFIQLHMIGDFALVKI
jgi:hypothetical protein